jgi:Ca2+-binding EF-hand superfamily protein
VTDFAANIRAGLAAMQPNREAFARHCVSEFDRNTDGSVSGAEFLKVFASLQRTDEVAGSGQTSYVSAGIRPTIFDCTLFPAFSRNYAISAYQAHSMLETYDRNGDQSVTLQELLYVDPPPVEETKQTDAQPADETPPPSGPAPLTAEQRADDLMALYDSTQKGYIDISDIVSAWVNDPSLGDISQAGNAISAWDRDGDETVTREELIAGYQNLDAANAMITALGDATSGTIKLAALTDAQLATIDMSREELSAWDADTNGELSRTEILNALRKASITTPETIAQALITHFDSDQSSTLNSDEFAQVLATYNMDSMQAQESFTAWDLDRDGAISSSEMASGINLIQDAKAQVAKFDIDNKGYFTLDDLQTAIAADPSSTTASAEDLMLWWDVDGDGKVTPQDVIARQNLNADQAASTA